MVAAEKFSEIPEKLTVDEIASQRGLTVMTVRKLLDKHLPDYVKKITLLKQNNAREAKSGDVEFYAYFNIEYFLYPKKLDINASPELASATS